jgi:AraC family transcriptional regulator of adaptative response/methylated-DNA-[protein]-cysteine methyltransferase
MGIEMNAKLNEKDQDFDKIILDFFSNIIETRPTISQHHKILNASWLDTKLGRMIVISDEQGLYLLDFLDREDLVSEVEKLKIKLNAVIILGRVKPIESIKIELEFYFKGELKNFKTPTHLLGSSFERVSWEELLQISYGQTKSYRNQAAAIGKPTACRAVARANGKNSLLIIIPCHRIINSNGSLGGYRGGLKRKQWLINHEKKHV